MVILDNGDVRYDELDLALGKIEMLRGAHDQCLMVGLIGAALDNAATARQVCREYGLAVPYWANADPRGTR